MQIFEFFVFLVLSGDFGGWVTFFYEMLVLVVF